MRQKLGEITDEQFAELELVLDFDTDGLRQMQRERRCGCSCNSISQNRKIFDLKKALLKKCVNPLKCSIEFAPVTWDASLPLWKNVQNMSLNFRKTCLVAVDIFRKTCYSIIIP